MSEELTPPRFPTMLRKMWSGGEVQAWIDENWNRRAQPAAPADAAPSVAPEPAPVAYKVWHREAKHCFCLASELPTEFRSDTGEPDGYFGGKVQPLFAHPPRAPLTEEQRRDLVKECGLDWQRGYMPLFEGDPTNRYAVLVEAVEAAHGIGGK